jgi:SAM-dependent methyltransferase
MDVCRICGNAEGNREFAVREMMFGLRDAFPYFQCAKCECLQIRDIPSDMAKYYPANYYSMEGSLPASKGLASDAARRLDALFRLGIANYGHTKRREIFDWFRYSRAGLSARILDVGCGRGALLHELRLDGFRDLSGVDPFVAKDLEYGNGIRIKKAQLWDLPGPYDLIMMHHSFEHMPEPMRTLEAASRLLAPGGALLIRIPVVGFAWREYGADWFQIDAPRHFYLHSRKSLAHLAERAGYRIDAVIYDSKASQLWASEQYRRDIPHRDPRSHGENPKQSGFSQAEIRAFERRARELNAAEDGDAACFILRRA